MLADVLPPPLNTIANTPATSHDLCAGCALELGAYKRGMAYLYPMVKDPAYVSPDLTAEPLPLPGLLKSDPIDLFD